MQIFWLGVCGIYVLSCNVIGHMKTRQGHDRFDQKLNNMNNAESQGLKETEGPFVITFHPCYLKGINSYLYIFFAVLIYRNK